MYDSRDREALRDSTANLWIAGVVLAIIIVAAAVVLEKRYNACDEKGGVMVRSFIHYECVVKKRL